jgi:CRISPR-associated protein Cas1
VATLLGGPRPDSERRVAQYRAFLNQEWRTAWSRRQVTGKLKGQARLLRAAASERPALKHELLAAAETISSIRESAAGTAGAGRQQLMGWEGAGSAAFFRAYPLLFAPALGFHQRNRRPPRDPVNAALSLGYTLAHVTAVAEIHKAGLDPYLGYFHEPLPGRESLACDVIEPYRPRVDAFVWRLFRERVLRPEHFGNRDGACLLGKAGRAEFYGAIELFLGPLGRAFRRTALILVRALMEAAGQPPPEAVGEEADEDAVP